MDRVERAIASACGIIALDGITVPKTVRDSIRRCLRDESFFDFAVVYVAGARAGYRSMHRLERSSDDPYCYDGTRTPVNKLNIRDPEVLMTKMRDVVPIRIAELERHPITSSMSSDYLKTIHRRLYGDIFSWAGEYRQSDLPDRPQACRSVHIPACVDALFDELKIEDFLSSSDDFCGRLAHYMTELLAIEPFRMGNEVCIRVLINSIAIMNGRYLDYSKASVSLMDIAVRRAIAGDMSQLEECLNAAIEDY